MGWEIDLSDDNGFCAVSTHHAGSTVHLGGSGDASMSLTWNYAPLYYQTVDTEHGLRWINGKSAKETLPRLKAAVAELGDKGRELDDYWAATEFNAKQGLRVLVGWAEQHPDATWSID